MTQSVFNDIDPNTKSGTQLAVDLNNFKASLLTQHSGASAPTYAEVGTEWLDSASAGLLIKKIYDGSQWVTINTLDTAAHIITYGGNNPTASFSISRTDDAADMLELYRNTQLVSDAGIVFTQRNDADVKKTMANVKMISDSIANGVENASFSIESMLNGTLTEAFNVSNTAMFANYLTGIGTRFLVTDENGNITSQALQNSSNLILNGNADTGDDTQYTATSLVFSKSSTSTELISGTSVFKAVSSAGSETLESETITLKNNCINQPLIVELEYKCGADWTIEVLNQLDTTLVQETINAFTPVSNESNNKKLFVSIPNATTTVKIKFTSTAADTLLFDNLKVFSQVSDEKDLYFERDLANNQSVASSLFTLTSLKNKAYKIEAKITRETDTNYAEAITEFYVSYDQNTSTWRIAKESINELESLETEIAFSMNGNDLEYTSSDITGSNYTGKINGKITRLL